MDSPGSLIATHSGLRGRPGAELSDDVVEQAIRGLARMLEQDGLPPRIALGRDERPSGEELAATAIQAALSAGLDVVDLGIASSPATKLAARRQVLGGAVIATGSHLDPALNGLKMVAAPSYGPVDIRQLPEPPSARGPRRGRLSRDASAAAGHAAAVRDSIDAAAVREANLSVRCEGGAGAAPSLLLDGLGCEAASSKVDVGLLLDADADRLSLVDETGAELDSELTLPLVMLAHGARRIVKGADTSGVVDQLAGERGGSVRTVPPGELHLVEALLEEGGDLAGEGNGGVIVPGVGLARDALAAGASVLWLLARSRRPLSAVAAELPRSALRRSTLTCADPEQRLAALRQLARHTGSELRRPEEGITVRWANGAWGLVRESATEPVIRVTVEAPTGEEAERLHDELVEAISLESLRR